VRDLRHFDWYGVLPVAGGIDDQPARRWSAMQMARKIREALAQSKVDASKMSKAQTDLIAWLNSGEDDGRR
jgi:hypothetical protein